jgi:hypothetical protein
MANSKFIKLIKKMNVRMNVRMPILRRSPILRLCLNSHDPFEQTPKQEHKTSIKKLLRNHK